MPRIFINLEAGCLQVNLMSTSAQINQLKYTTILLSNTWPTTLYNHRTTTFIIIIIPTTMAFNTFNSRFSYVAT